MRHDDVCVCARVYVFLRVCCCFIATSTHYIAPVYPVFIHFRLAACFHASCLTQLPPTHLRCAHNRCFFYITGLSRTLLVSDTFTARPRSVPHCFWPAFLCGCQPPYVFFIGNKTSRTPFPSGGLYGAAATRGPISRTRCHATPESGHFLGR